MRRALFYFSLVGVLTTALQGQNRVTGPVAGFVFDRSARVLRPIVGIPGASTLGDALDGAADLMAAYVSPRQDSALLVTSEGGRFVRLNGSGAAAIDCEGLPAAPQRAVFSPSGTAAAVYAAGRVYLVSGLPGSATLTASFDIGTARAMPQARGRGGRAEPFSFAVADDGRSLLLAANRSVRLLGAAGENLAIMDSGPGAMVAFAPAGHDAAVADGAGVTLLRNVFAGAARTLLSAPGETQGGAAGVAFSANGASLFVVRTGAREVAAFDLARGGRTAIACDCVPDGLFPMGGLFRLNEGGAGPVWLLDPRSDGPRTLFVPARSE